MRTSTLAARSRLHSPSAPVPSPSPPGAAGPHCISTSSPPDLRCPLTSSSPRRSNAPLPPPTRSLRRTRAPRAPPTRASLRCPSGASMHIPPTHTCVCPDASTQRCSGRWEGWGGGGGGVVPDWNARRAGLPPPTHPLPARDARRVTLPPPHGPHPSPWRAAPLPMARSSPPHGAQILRGAEARRDQGGIQGAAARVEGRCACGPPCWRRLLEAAVLEAAAHPRASGMPMYVLETASCQVHAHAHAHAQHIVCACM